MSNTTIMNFPLPSTQVNKPRTSSTSRPQKPSGTPKRNNGKSRYAQKSRGNAKKSPVAAKPRGPVYTYTSDCHKAPATKKPCTAVNKKDALTQTLGKFRCGECGKRCNVTVSKFKVVTVPTSNGVGTMTYGEEVPNAAV